MFPVIHAWFYNQGNWAQSNWVIFSDKHLQHSHLWLDRIILVLVMFFMYIVITSTNTILFCLVWFSNNFDISKSQYITFVILRHFPFIPTLLWGLVRNIPWILSSAFSVSTKASVYLLILCLNNLFIDESEVLESPTIIKSQF